MRKAVHELAEIGAEEHGAPPLHLTVAVDLFLDAAVTASTTPPRLGEPDHTFSSSSPVGACPCVTPRRPLSRASLRDRRRVAPQRHASPRRFDLFRQPREAVLILPENPAFEPMIFLREQCTAVAVAPRRGLGSPGTHARRPHVPWKAHPRAKPHLAEFLAPLLAALLPFRLAPPLPLIYAVLRRCASARVRRPWCGRNFMHACAHASASRAP
jgi:hypothetical protein